MTKPIIISMLVSDLAEPYSESIQVDCVDCGQPVWVTKEQIMKPELKVTPDTVDGLCLQCFGKRVEELHE